MPENDIYNNKEKYEGFLRNLDLILVPSEKRTDKNANKSVYFCKHKDNIKHFRKLAEKFDTRDLSYVRRCRILNTLRLISYATKKDFSKCDRDDIDRIVAFVSQPITISDDTGADFFCTLFDIKKIKTLEKILPSRRSPVSTRKKIFALVLISNGCDNFCAYCIVPIARGREISRTVIDIASDVKKAITNGAKEIWLLGQTVNSYKNEGVKFHNLLRLINDIDGDFWIRFTSPHPKDFSDELIKAMAECDKFAHYINLPVQSGNNTVLKRMGRPYTVGHYKKLVGKIRKAMPDIAISTDIIVGFPGETRKQFEDTKKLFEEIKFDMAFISEYSPRPKTVAYKMFKDNVSHKEKESRKNELNEILKKTALENNQKLVGKTVKVLNGRTEGNKPIEITNVKHSMLNIKNNFVSAKIIKASIWSLKGKLI